MKPNDGLYELVARTTYKPGYKFELKPYTGYAYSLSLHTAIIPKNFSPDSPMRLAVTKFLPREALDHLTTDAQTMVLLGLAFWWETHELAEWFKVEDKEVLPVDRDHDSYLHTDRQMYADLDMLRQWGEFLRTRRFV